MLMWCRSNISEYRMRFSIQYVRSNRINKATPEVEEVMVVVAIPVVETEDEVVVKVAEAVVGEGEVEARFSTEVCATPNYPGHRFNFHTTPLITNLQLAN